MNSAEKSRAIRAWCGAKIRFELSTDASVATFRRIDCADRALFVAIPETEDDALEYLTRIYCVDGSPLHALKNEVLR